MMEYTEKQWGWIKVSILPFMVAIVNTATAISYLLIKRGFLPPPSVELGLFTLDVNNYRFLLVIVPMFSAIMVSSILAEHDFNITFIGGIAIILETILMTFAFLLLVPQLIGDVAFIGGISIFAKDVMLFVVLPLVPTTFAGIIIGLVLGDRWMFTGHTPEEIEYKDNMEEWFTFLERIEVERKRESDEALASRDMD